MMLSRDESGKSGVGTAGESTRSSCGDSYGGRGAEMKTATKSGALTSTFAAGSGTKAKKRLKKKIQDLVTGDDVFCTFCEDAGTYGITTWPMNRLLICGQCWGTHDEWKQRVVTCAKCGYKFQK
ncbi:unnamed protein product, partial [Amoebophrya sp. A120]|eukprot:GSA120T00003929001.1